jgi:hypothetical protein
MEYDLIIELSSDVGDALTPSMPNWKKIKERAAKSPSFSNDDVFGIGHQTTKHRLEADVCIYQY